MPNIEIKAYYPDLANGQEIAKKLQTEYVGILRQVDTYFHVPHGKLKLREIDGMKSWLIPYAKTYEDRPARSDYQLLESTDPAALKDILDRLFGIRSVVDKTREVFLIENVRVHLDQVKGAGNFLEFEAVFDVDTPEIRERETKRLIDLMNTFGIHKSDLVTTGYMELVEESELAVRSQRPESRSSASREVNP